MNRRTLADIENRAIKNFKIVHTILSGGRHELIVTTLQGVVIERFEGGTAEDVEHHLRDLGYERIPSFVAFEIDQGTSP